MKYKETQYKKVENLMHNKDVFYGDMGKGKFKSREYPFILKNAENNLFYSCRKSAINYMNNYKAFWNGSLTNHTLSSQISSLNHLFLIREDKQAVLSVAKVIDSSVVDVLSITTDDFMTAYIQFEAVSDFDNLNEGKPNRGANCTSVDVLIYGIRENGKKVILPIEWKYVENYDNKRVFEEVGYKNGVKCTNKKGLTKGEERQRRYFDLIESSKQLKPIAKEISNYEPFYQLMRQTLWSEKLIENPNETISAEDYVHAHIIPKENAELLDKKYAPTGKGMEATWREVINEQSKYKIISPKDLLANIDKTKYAELIEYLQKRYW